MRLATGTSVATPPRCAFARAMRSSLILRARASSDSAASAGALVRFGDPVKAAMTLRRGDAFSLAGLLAGLLRFGDFFGDFAGEKGPAAGGTTGPASA